ncbi:MAG: hypothetical protein AB7U29_10450 [Desulfobulbus sp.]
MLPSQSYPILHLKLPSEVLLGFASLLQHGVLFPLQQPVPLLSFLVSLPGFSADYIEKNIQTIFINGVPADSLNRELVDGTTVALSAAMPGLAGAIFRRQGFHGSLRSQPVTQSPKTRAGAGFLTLKLFNSIATDRVEDLLRHGILISGKALTNFARMRGHLFEAPACLRLENQKMNYTDLLNKAGEIEIILLRWVQ